jgi:hypothetical protein
MRLLLSTVQRLEIGEFVLEGAYIAFGNEGRKGRNGGGEMVLKNGFILRLHFLYFSIIPPHQPTNLRSPTGNKVAVEQEPESDNQGNRQLVGLWL